MLITYASSGGMEVAAVKQIFLRSEKLYNVRYNKYLGDGDTYFCLSHDRRAKTLWFTV